MLKRYLLIAAMGISLLGATASPAYAAGCNRRKLRNAEINYRTAVRKHGARSRQAEHWRAEVEQERARCR